jgi:DNA-binding MltR family transcriptional regulator
MGNDEPKPLDVKAEFAALNGAMRGGHSFLKPELDDTTVVLLATSLIDKFLQFVMLLKFGSKPSRTEFEDVFSGTGPLATFSAKISLATAFGIVFGDVKHDLKILRKIRNEYAHSPYHLFLKDFPQCRSLKMVPTKPIEMLPIERKRFVESSAAIVSILSVSATKVIMENHLLQQNDANVKSMTKTMLEWFLSGAKGKAPFGLN